MIIQYLMIISLIGIIAIAAGIKFNELEERIKELEEQIKGK